MSLVNQSKPTTAVENASKVSNEETWDSNTTTWDTETRTWDEMGSQISNTSKPTTTMTNVAKPA